MNQTISFQFGVETLSGTVTAEHTSYVTVLVDDSAPVMAGRTITLSRDCF